MNKEFLHMQKLAGLITEGEYQAKMNEGDYDSMSDHALIKAANEAGIEEIVTMDGEGGLANREEVIDHLNEFEHDNHGSFDAEMGEMEESFEDTLNEAMKKLTEASFPAITNPLTKDLYSKLSKKIKVTTTNSDLKDMLAKDAKVQDLKPTDQRSLRIALEAIIANHKKMER